MWEGFVVAVALVGFLGTLRVVLGVRRRRLALASLGPLTRASRGVTLKVSARGARFWSFVEPDQPVDLTGDLALTAERFVLASQEGVLLDLGPADGARLASARCTGPGRLVLEGDVGKAEKDAQNPAGTWRIDVSVDHAETWAEALAPFVAAASGAPPRTSWQA